MKILKGLFAVLLATVIISQVCIIATGDNNPYMESA